jgi:acetylornithine/succinyldiaminopimelate/putrescine aminotransferase
LGIEFKENASTVHKALLDRKIITGTSSNPKVLRLLPPLCLTEAHVDEFVLATDEN